MKLPVFNTLSTGFGLVKRNPVLFIPVIVLMVITIINQLIFPYNYPVQYDMSYIVFNVAYVLASLFIYGILIVMSGIVLKKKKISMQDAVVTTAKRIIRVIIGTILATIIFAIPIAVPLLLQFVIPSAIALILIAVPVSVYLLVRLFFYEFAILLDNTPVVDSLKKSWKIMKGNWWRVFVMLLLMGLAYLPVGVVIYAFSSYNMNLFNILFSVASSILLTWYTATLVVAYVRMRK